MCSTPQRAVWHDNRSSPVDLARSVGRPRTLPGRKFLQTWWQCFGWAASQLCSLCAETLCARTIAQKITPAVLEATSPFQYALGSKGREEFVAHAIQSLTDVDSRATVLSIDGISAFDLISKTAMLDGMAQIRGGEAVMPFVLQFCSHNTSGLTITGKPCDSPGGGVSMLYFQDSMVHCKRCKIL